MISSEHTGYNSWSVHNTDTCSNQFELESLYMLKILSELYDD